MQSGADIRLKINAQESALAELCRKYGARLLVDDAHGLGVVGQGGRGTASHFGLVDETRQLAKQLLSVLSPYVAAGLSIVGLEPSSLLMLRDEYKTLGLGQPAVVLAKQALLLQPQARVLQI